MQKICEAVRHNPLFRGIEELEPMFDCLGAQTRLFARDAVILLAGDAALYVGIVVSGGVKIIKEDEEGNSAIITELGPSELFGEVFACAGVEHSPVTVVATQKSEILFIDYRKIIYTCASSCVFHNRLIENMLMLIARKTLMLNQKIEVLSKRTTREKIFSFFDVIRGGKRAFAVPYNREEMAQYLCVDRSALSAELGRMRDEGLIRFHKNEFELV